MDTKYEPLYQGMSAMTPYVLGESSDDVAESMTAAMLSARAGSKAATSEPIGPVGTPSQPNSARCDSTIICPRNSPTEAQHSARNSTYYEYYNM
jgi:hypothetical protein